jgi:hypothetical protein
LNDTPEKANVFDRILLASIKYLGKHPCPRCLVERRDISDFGSKADLKHRERLVWIDDGPHQFEVEAARKLIYTKAISVNSDRIKAILGPKSLVPTWVSICHVPANCTLLIFTLECIFGASSSLWIQFLLNVRTGSTS